MEEFHNFFRISHAHHQIKWGDKAAGRAVLKACDTRAFADERRRLLRMSLLPQWAYQGLTRLKRALRAKKKRGPKAVRAGGEWAPCRAWRRVYFFSLAAGAGAAAAGAAPGFTSSSSTSKISVAPGGMLPLPLSP